MAEDQGLVIAGEALEVDLVDVIRRLSMDEAQVLYDISGIVQEDFVPPHPEAPKAEHRAHEANVSKVVRNPAFKRAITCIAYMRKHPEAELETVLDLVGKISQLDVSLAIAGGGEEVPPATSSPSEPEKQKPSDEHSRSEDSGILSTNGSAQQGEIPEATGITESAISSPASARTG